VIGVKGENRSAKGRLPLIREFAAKKKTGPHSETGFVYQFKRNGSHHNPRYRSSIQAMIEGWIPPIILAQLNGFKPFDVDANLASTIV